MDKNSPWAVCEDQMDYVRIALALETLAYHNKNYLDKCMCDNKRFSEEIQALLLAALREATP